MQVTNQALQLQGILDQGKPTLAGIVMLGEYPQAYFPQLSVTAMVAAGEEIGETGSRGERFLDNQRIEGTLSQMLECTLTFVRRNTRTATIIDEEGIRSDRSEYPMVAVREIIINALIHRDYSIHKDHSPVRVVIYPDRLEVENPGGLYGRITVDELGKRAADTRNPFIAGGMEVLSGTENRFSGIPTIVSEMKKAGLRPAVFESSRGVFKVTLYNAVMKEAESEHVFLSETMQKIVAFCDIPRSRKEIGQYLGIETPSYLSNKYLKPLLQMNQLKMTRPDAPRSKNQKYVKVEQG